MVARGTAIWESLVGKPRGKATDPLIHTKGSATLLLQLERKSHVHAPTREESPRYLSPFQGNLFSLHCLDFQARIDSHHGGTWDSPVGKPRGKASWESLEGKPQIPRSTRREA